MGKVLTYAVASIISKAPLFRRIWPFTYNGAMHLGDHFLIKMSSLPFVKKMHRKEKRT